MNQRLSDLYSHVSVHATADLEHEAAIDLLLLVMTDSESRTVDSYANMPLPWFCPVTVDPFTNASDWLKLGPSPLPATEPPEGPTVRDGASGASRASGTRTQPPSTAARSAAEFGAAAAHARSAGPSASKTADALLPSARPSASSSAARRGPAQATFANFAMPWVVASARCAVPKASLQ